MREILSFSTRFWVVFRFERLDDILEKPQLSTKVMDGAMENGHGEDWTRYA